MTYKRRSASKFNIDHSELGKLARTVDGHLFRSNAEASRYCTLKQMQAVGEIFDLALGRKHDLIVNGIKVGVYTPDFTYLDAKGTPIIEEFKSGTSGKETDYRLRKKIFEACTGLVVTEVIKK